MACAQRTAWLRSEGALGRKGRCAVIQLLIGAAALIVSYGCTAHTEPTSAEVAWAARTEVAVREELGPRSPVVASLPLGTQVDIIGRRRKLVRVRAGKGVEGWAREEELISSDVKQRLEVLSDRVENFVPQGELRAFDELNVHLEPYRWSPTIYRLDKDEGAQLLTRKRVVRREEGAVTMPPDAPREDWHLVRLPTGAAGWILGSRTYSAIPIEVAQYAEGRRILAYFGLGSVTDGLTGEKKETWLWVQSPRESQEYDFDRIRVFRWSNHRNAYQTIKIERGVEGRLPVTMLPSIETSHGTGPGYRLILSRDGDLVARTFALIGQRIYLASEAPAQPPPRIEERVAVPTPEQLRPPTLSERLFSWLPSLF